MVLYNMADFNVKFDGGSFKGDVSFGEVNRVSDGGYDSGYAAGYDSGYAKGADAGYESGYAQGHKDGNAEGYEKGHTDGHTEGYAAGLAAREFETWTITLVDGSVIEKDVALV